MESFGTRLKRARERAELTQNKLAKKLGLSSSGIISQWESDMFMPTGWNAYLLAEALNVSLDWLWSRTDKVEVQR